VGCFALSAIAGGACALAAYVLMMADVQPTRWAVDALVAGAALGVVYGLTVWWWGRPLRKTLSLIDRIRAGEAPIEELSDIRRGGRKLVPVLQDLLREIRQQGCEIATLKDEMRQRVAQRTDALERTIGTLRHQATRDPLTGLFNRRFLDQYLPQVVQRSISQGMDVAVLMCDLDHFKLLNDTLGHAAGDDLLKSVGQIIRSTVRGEDVPFRAGGDEFLVVLPSSTAEHAWALGERLASLVEGLGKSLKLSKRPRLSFGVACLTEVTDRSVAGLLERADRALYERKRTRQGGAAADLAVPSAALQA
jgi:diguanylate cyclase (GGDEF)-like protein